MSKPKMKVRLEIFDNQTMMLELALDKELCSLATTPLTTQKYSESLENKLQSLLTNDDSRVVDMVRSARNILIHEVLAGLERALAGYLNGGDKQI